MCDYRPQAQASLANVYLNDQLGDCVIAGIAHVVGTLRGNSGAAPFLYSNDEIVALYSAIGGYVPGDASTDQGCNEQTALNYWQNNGAPAGSTHRIVGWIAVNPADPTEFRTALWLFENLYFGMELPDPWINPAPASSNFVWDVAGPADPNNGHCVVGVGYTPQGVIIDTWGMTGLMTDAAIGQYASSNSGGELYAVLSQDAINRATMKAPSGFDWSQLVADFDSMGGNVAVPTAPQPQPPAASSFVPTQAMPPSSVEIALLEAEFQFLISCRGKAIIPFLQASLVTAPGLTASQKAELAACLNSLA
jgi:hypothetical protein